MALRENIVWTALSDLPGVEIVSAQSNQRPWCVYHRTYTICNIDNFLSDSGQPCSGAADWVYRRKVHQNFGHSLMLMEPGEIHRNTKPTPPVDFSVALFEPKLVAGIAMEAGLSPQPHFREASIEDPDVYRAFVRFHQALKQETSLLHRQALLVDCIGRLLSGHCERNARPLARPGRKPLLRAREFLEQHAMYKVSLDQLAQIAGLSRFHFLRSFTREFGLPPHAYQISRRIERIRLLLRAGMPVHSLEAGFADQSHLIRHFKRATGVTPGRYAAMVGNAPAPLLTRETEQQ